MAYRCRWDNDWTMEFVSRGSLALTGHASEDLIENGKASWSKLIHAGDLGDVFRRVRRALEDRKPFQMEYRLELADGLVKWVLEEGQVVSAANEQPHQIEGYIVDISAQKRHEEDLRRQEAQTRQAIEKTRDAFIAVDIDGKIRDWNRQAEETFGWPREEAIGRDVAATLVPADDRDQFNEKFRSLHETQVDHLVLQNGKLLALRRNGETFPVELTVWPGQKKDLQLFNAYVHDLGERQALEDQLAKAEDSLERVMREDSLTGLPNSKAFENDMIRATSFARRWRQPLTLMIANIDAFKSITEQFGHSKGDELLVEFAKLWKSSCRLEDVTAKLDGPDFALLLPNTDLPQAEIVANRFQKKVQETTMSVELNVTATLGITKFTSADSTDTFVERAWQALEQAKNKGPNSIAALEAATQPVEESV